MIGFLLLALVAKTSHAAPQTISIPFLFPAVTATIDYSPKSSASSEYAQFDACRLATVPGTGCGGGVATARFFQFSTPNGPDDLFNVVNRCIGIRQGNRYFLSTPIVFDAATQEVSCDPGPEEIAVIHLLLCYGKPSGAHCSLATACFEGDHMGGMCTQDYKCDEIRVARGKDGP